MGLNDLIDSKKEQKQEKSNNTPSEKAYKSYYLEKSTIDLINRITLHEKINNPKYNLADAFAEAFALLAQKRGVSSSGNPPFLKNPF